MTFRAFQLSFTHVIRSREYATQKAEDQFGAVNLSVRFNTFTMAGLNRAMVS